MSSEEIRSLLVDTTGAPLITECPAEGCMTLDLWTMECAPGVTWVCICGDGHMSWITKEPQS
jgi:hypothetical protein